MRQALLQLGEEIQPVGIFLQAVQLERDSGRGIVVGEGAFGPQLFGFGIYQQEVCVMVAIGPFEAFKDQFSANGRTFLCRTRQVRDLRIQGGQYAADVGVVAAQEL